MEQFKNILVGVDLSEADRLVSDKPAAPSEAAIQRALWLARANDAKVQFMSVLDPSTLQLPSCAESQAAQNASRMVSMQAADRNIEERVGELQSAYNQRWQTATSEELLEDVGGFEALMQEERNSKAM